jgi:hypothetical protein
MRVEMTGGPPELVLVSANPVGLRCAMWPESLCVVGEMAGDTMVVSRVGPTEGRGEQVARIRVRDVLESWGWSLSPDGSRIALVEQDTIRILDLKSHEVSTVVLRNSDEVRRLGEPNGISWAPSGRGFFLTTFDVLFYVDLAGQTRELHRTFGVLSPPVPSPDGRHIAFQQWNPVEGNVWLLEGF